jgi:outer membrane protein assembly factor BamB
MRSKVLATLLALSIIASINADDWPQYRGPKRDDVSAEKGLLQSWPKEGPQLLWTYTNTGVGYSGVSVVGDRLYTIGGRDDKEYLIALDLKSVKDKSVTEAWAVEVGPLFTFKTNQWSAGPSATPTVDGDRIYAVGGNGDLLCCDTSGKEKWRKNLPRELEAQVNPIGGGPKNLGWGFTASPLIDGEQLVCIVGGPKGTVAALNKKDGKELWRSVDLKDQAAYTSPVVAEFDGVRQYVVLTNQGLAGIAAKDGKVLWSHRRMPAWGTEVVNTPIVSGSFVFVTVGVAQGTELIKVVRDGISFKTEKVYANNNLSNHHGNVVLVGEHVYGFSQGKGWTCLNLQTGEPAWAERKFPGGSMTCADGRFYCFSENDGTAALIAVSKEGYSEHGRFKLPQSSKLRKPSGKIWTPPVVANGRLYLRDQELLFCYDVKAK